MILKYCLLEKQTRNTNNNSRSKFLLIFICLFSFVTESNPAFSDENDAWRQAYAQGNFVTALDIVRPLAEQRNQLAEYRLGIHLELGRGIPIDITEAIRWYIRSAESGFVPAQMALGRLYSQNSENGIITDGSEALRWYDMASLYENDAHIEIAKMYLDGNLLPQNNIEAARRYRLAAERGSSRAQVALGIMYTEGRGVARSEAEAVHWFREAANQNNSEGQARLGLMYANGAGVEQDVAEALHWYRRGAEGGLQGRMAQRLLGDAYYQGIGVATNPVEAARWFRIAADNLDPDAMTRLGVMYFEGEFIEHNPVEAARLYRLSSSMGGGSEPRVRLGAMYYIGEGVPKSYSEALRWFRLAARSRPTDLWVSGAQSMLGSIYQNGQGIPQDYITAHMWHNISAANGNESSRRSRDELSDIMSASDISEAQRRARVCMSSGYEDCD